MRLPHATAIILDNRSTDIDDVETVHRVVDLEDIIDCASLRDALRHAAYAAYVSASKECEIRNKDEPLPFRFVPIMGPDGSG